jgi:phosphate transport system substrate-binding protein
MTHTTRTRLGLAAIAAGVLAISATAFAARGLTIKGSDTMVILGQRWAEKYMATHPGAVIQVTGGGSGTGIAALINGTTDICQASRPMKEAEKRKLRDRYQTMGIEIPVARDGLTVYFHESNPVKELTLAQIRDIYLGRTTNWKQLGGPDAAITLYGRENSSGTYVYFKDNVLGGRDFDPRVQTLPGTAAVVNAVAKDPHGIGYGGAAYAKGVKECGVRKDEKSPAVLPSAQTVQDGSYPIARDLYFYMRTRPAGDTKKFVDWVLSTEGQALVSQVGYFPVTARNRAAQR